MECGKWKDDPIETRLCRICNKSVLGDEYPFVLFCEKLRHERTQFYIELVQKPDIDVSSKQDVQLKCIFQWENLKTTGRHIEIMWQRRKELLCNLEKEEKSECG